MRVAGLLLDQMLLPAWSATLRCTRSKSLLRLVNLLLRLLGPVQLLGPLCACSVSLSVHLLQLHCKSRTLLHVAGSTAACC